MFINCTIFKKFFSEGQVLLKMSKLMKPVRNFTALEKHVSECNKKYVLVHNREKMAQFREKPPCVVSKWRKILRESLFADMGL